MARPKKHPFDLGVWNKLLMLETQFKKLGEPLSISRLMDAMQIKKNVAERWMFCLQHKHIIQAKYSEETISEGDRVLIITDIHVPYHDKIAVEAALAYGDRLQPTIIVINGDLIDFYKISRFLKNPKNHDVSYELAETRKFLTELRHRFPNARIIYKEGNHEMRLEHYIIGNASEIYNLVDDLLANKLGFSTLNIEYKPTFFKLGKLWFLHGHEKPAGGDPEYVTNVIFKYVLDHFIVGHFHRTQEKIYRRIDGTTFWGGALGYLAGPMEYAPINKWNQGVAGIYFGRNGNFKPELQVIQDGELY